MCGYVALVGAADRDVDPSRLLLALRRRGPDGSGWLAEEGFCAAHTRLAILDTTSAAEQPMESPDGRYVLVYNGEIYNYVELREELVEIGWRFSGTGDTEVLLGQLAVHGPACLPRLRGMFSFVFWDRSAKQALAARDPFGIKPLYCANLAGGVVFGSEVRAMCAFGGRMSVSCDAVTSLLVTGSVPAPLTILSEVRVVPPGHFVVVAPTGERVTRYATPESAAPCGLRGDELLDALDDVLTESVRLQLRSDVPVGVFLSGGIDSSLIVSYAAEHVPELRTFSVGFATTVRGANELDPAGMVARHVGTSHTEILVTPEDFERELPILPLAVDQPSSDGPNSYFVSQAASRSVKVALSGQGGDELFAGYNIFRLMRMLDGAVPAHGIGLGDRRVGPILLGLPVAIQANWWARGFALLLAGPSASLLASVANPLFAAHEVGARPVLCKGRATGDSINDLALRLRETYLANTLLRDMDAMSMWHSLEVRVPLVDPVVARFADSIPGSLKVGRRQGKLLLRALARRRLGKELSDLPKHGFELPLRDWLRRPSCRAIVTDVLSVGSVRASDLVDPALVERVLSEFYSSPPNRLDWLRAQRLWTLFALHAWHSEWQSGRLWQTNAVVGARP